MPDVYNTHKKTEKEANYYKKKQNMNTKHIKERR